MNHQPFRDWLLSEEKLSADQIEVLQEHLQSCESCKQIEGAWSEVEAAFHEVPQKNPAPGFIIRWKANLADYQAREQKRRGWMTIGFTVLIVTVLFGLLTTQLWSLLQAPGSYLVAWFNRLLSLVSIFYTLQDLFRPLTGNAPVYTFLGMFFLVGMISFMSVLWVATYRKLSMERRFV
ncbi:MAG: hypothetical protein A2Y53_00460 [Chloroflexi bacterium RBG_16_47_49]|nr:MAG: hypothetical protein A2Y53_00460 [Chloroflexi bacterium RBG_16_47_49]